MTKGAQRLGTEICGYCKWWNAPAYIVGMRREKPPIDMYGILGGQEAECRARAPKGQKYQYGNSRPYWPRTNGKDWCRKYETGIQS